MCRLFNRRPTFSGENTFELLSDVPPAIATVRTPFIAHARTIAAGDDRHRQRGICPGANVHGVRRTPLIYGRDVHHAAAVSLVLISPCRRCYRQWPSGSRIVAPSSRAAYIIIVSRPPTLCLPAHGHWATGLGYPPGCALAVRHDRPLRKDGIHAGGSTDEILSARASLRDARTYFRPLSYQWSVFAHGYATADKNRTQRNRTTFRDSGRLNTST